VIFVRTPLRSAIALLFAIVHIVAAGGASIADGRMEAEAAASTAYAHIEAHGTADCPRVHLEDCTLCRVLQAGAERPGAAVGSVEGGVGGAGGQRSVTEVRSRRHSGPVSLRAPPRTAVPRTIAA
jgi:hypothetical protein